MRTAARKLSFDQHRQHDYNEDTWILRKPDHSTLRFCNAKSLFAITGTNILHHTAKPEFLI